MQNKQENFDQSGAVTLVMLVMLAVFFVFATGILGWIFQSRKAIALKTHEMQALQVSEAGVSYYRWHLAHNEADYQDGNDWCCGDDDGDGVGDPDLSVEDCGRVCGPYTKVYKDFSGNDLGVYSLLITAPLAGSSFVEIESTGRINRDNSVEKTIRISLAKKSLAEYGLLSSTAAWFGNTEAVSGALHSNGGIRMDGTCDAEITSSAEDEYNCYDAHHGCPLSNPMAPRIWSSTDNDVCQSYWNSSQVPTKNFELFTHNLDDIKAGALESRTYFGPTPSSRFGYDLVFDGNGGFDIRQVSTLCDALKFEDDSGGTSVWNTENERACDFRPSIHKSIPENGLIFVADDLWISGEVKGRVTVAASRFSISSSGRADIKIYDNLVYDQRYSGDDVLGLMAEGNIIVTQGAPGRLLNTTLHIDAMMLAQNGHVYGRNYYTNYLKQGKILVYGGIVTNKFWTWSYSTNNIVTDGYVNTVLTYDSNLIFSPPPSFPSEDDFEIKSWSEIK